MNPSFIFLPDISGFTHFVNQTEASHSGHIIQELLELLIDTQQLGLKLAEIEGDALFFYAHERVPSPRELFVQTEKMFSAFHRHLIKYDLQRICNCGACGTACNLTLKFIAHAGPLEFIQIKNQRKPFGKEVISAHRLMKNEVPSDEYLLLSEGLLAAWQDQAIEVPEGLEVAQGQSSYDFGEVKYDYYTLQKWKENIQPDLINSDYFRHPKPLSAQQLINASPHELFELISNLEYRMQWNEDISDLEYDRDKINRAGTEHLCIVQGYDLILETMATNNEEEPFEYIEKLKKFPLPLIQEMTNYFRVEHQGDGQSLVTLEFHIKLPRLLDWLMRSVMKKALGEKMRMTLTKLKEVAEERMY